MVLQDIMDKLLSGNGKLSILYFFETKHYMFNSNEGLKFKPMSHNNKLCFTCQNLDSGKERTIEGCQ